MGYLLTYRNSQPNTGMSQERKSKLEALSGPEPPSAGTLLKEDMSVRILLDFSINNAADTLVF
ncbi:uncharacterized protein N7503_011303 [Penicillium pulvis]|uniref:uncharacterized protein n=1 Tax=Penicillium pulvis TaxID=1562058 RepID=UPI002547363D|nr:uncharacterized protein N7503_011303 [Penicillium pulvis]KAJ5786091.1 hypothetical protein N7503_011303 [Penicillium pulvis]